MTCPDCIIAATSANWPGYRAGCRGCSVRALANGIEYFEAKKNGKFTAKYRAALESLLGDDWKAGHKDVEAEHQRLKQMRKKLPP